MKYLVISLFLFLSNNALANECQLYSDEIVASADGHETSRERFVVVATPVDSSRLKGCPLKVMSDTSEGITIIQNLIAVFPDGKIKGNFNCRYDGAPVIKGFHSSWMDCHKQ